MTHRPDPGANLDEGSPAADPPTHDGPTATLRELAALFLRLGLTAFGGPAVHIAILENEVVRRRRWMPSARFLDLLGVSNLLPGPSSTELAMFIGYEQAGWRGLLIGGGCFIAPAAIMVGVMAWAYVRFGALPQVEGVLYGVKPVVIAIVLQALWALAPKAIKKSVGLSSLALVAGVAFALRGDALVVLLGGGAAAAAMWLATRPQDARSMVPGLIPALVANGVPAGASVGLAALFLAFLKIGSVVFGSGYVLLAFLRADLVDRLHWLTEAQLLDAVAVGQVTPGPVFTTATFIGYLVAGGWGALVATVGIFLPAFVLVAAARPLVARLRRSGLAGAFLDGVNVAALALMAVVTAQLARTAWVDPPTVLLALVSVLLLFRTRVNTTWLVLGGAVVGFLAKRAS